MGWKMKVLSLFDGMACGMLAMQSAGIKVDRYVAFEIDKYAVQTSSHNFLMIEHRGNVFHADFTEYSGFDYLVGGSPCTYWSVAQKNNRETEASGMGWELFSQYVRALHEAQPMYFIYENNKSMSNAIRQSITGTFGFEPICINSALVSAQNRQRLYWVGKRNPDGTYSRVHVDQPDDRGILMRDILDGLTAHRIPEYGIVDKGRPLGANYSNNCGGFEHRMFSANPKKQQVDMVAMSVRVGAMPRPNGDLSTSQAFRVYSVDGKSVNITAGGGGAGGKTGLYAVPVHPTVGELTHTCEYNVTPEGTLRVAYTDKSESQGYRVYSTDFKSVCLRSTAPGRNAELIADKIPGLATPCEWDENGKPIKSISAADSKTYPVYEVKDGKITIKGKQYPIKLADGFYIIRKLTVNECKRLQTVPEWYEFPVSDTQAYKMLGNGWTVEVIAHLIKATQADVQEEEQLDLFKMWG